MLCLLALFLSPGAGVDPKEFWGQFYDHPRKLRRELGAQVLLREKVPSVAEFVKFAGGVPGESKSVHERKLRGLYVDYEDGVVLVPGDIGRDEARLAIDGSAGSS